MSTVLRGPVAGPVAAAGAHSGLHDAAGVSAAERLCALRRQVFGVSFAPGAERVSVVVYALTTAHGDPADALAEAQGFAFSRRWQVRGCFHDVTGDTEPRTRPGWARVRRALLEQRAHGVLMPTRTHLSTCDRLYRVELCWCRDHRVFLALVHPETAL
ncbi:hypothetical protein JO379_000214 [Streptomyces syringium]|uniref:Uncharacterized protein n=1 Tax=Streptomyces syringium TaxID=76729 RepID=A0ABS4XWM9_9ACTN|nr:hypothetical protein [Streptomyces syringium]